MVNMKDGLVDKVLVWESGAKSLIRGSATQLLCGSGQMSVSVPYLSYGSIMLLVYHSLLAMLIYNGV